MGGEGGHEGGKSELGSAHAGKLGEMLDSAIDALNLISNHVLAPDPKSCYNSGNPSGKT